VDETGKQQDRPAHADGGKPPGQHRPPVPGEEVPAAAAPAPAAAPDGAGPAQAAPAPAAAQSVSGQQRANRVLGELLDTAATQGLPLIDWTIAADGTRLTGRCTAYTAPGRRRADFEAWSTLLGADATEGTADGQTTRLAALAERGNGQLTIEIIADLYDDLSTAFSNPTQHAWRSP
jgi:hypothetical protein